MCFPEVASEKPVDFSSFTQNISCDDTIVMFAVGVGSECGSMGGFDEMWVVRGIAGTRYEVCHFPTLSSVERIRGSGRPQFGCASMWCGDVIPLHALSLGSNYRNRDRHLLYPLQISRRRREETIVT